MLSLDLVQKLVSLIITSYKVKIKVYCKETIQIIYIIFNARCIDRLF